MSIHHCGISHLINDTQIKVYPGKTIITGLRAFDLNENPTYGEIVVRLTNIEKWQHKNNHYSWTYDVIYMLPIEQLIQAVYSDRCILLNFTIFSESTNNIMDIRNNRHT